MASPFRNPDAMGGGRRADPPQPGSELARWQDRREQAARDRRRYEPVWALCQAFIANKQWVGWSKRDRRIVSEPNPGNRERHTVNVLTPYLMTNVGKFAGDDLRPQLLFRTEGKEQEMFARQANLSVEYAWDEELDADERLYEAIVRMCSFGIAGVQAMWTPDSGPLIAKDVPFRDGKPILDISQQMQTVADAAPGSLEFRDVRGRCEWRVWSPTNILPPPGVNHERDFPWLIIESPVSLEKLRMQFGDKADNLTEQGLASVDMIGLRELDTGIEGASQTTAGRLRGHAMVSRGYEMPTRRHPRGRTVIWSQDSMLETKDRLPYLINDQPYVGIRFFKYNPVPDRFWPIGLVEPGIGPQRQRNRSRSQYIEMKDRAGLGRIYTRPGGVSATQLEGGKVAEVIEVRQGIEMPTETSGVGPGPWLKDDVAMGDADMDKVMGMGQVTLGNAAGGGVSAYSAMSLLAEQDDRRVGQIIKQIRNNVSWLVKFTVQDMRTYWGARKQVALAGEDGKLEAFVFNATRIPTELFVKVGKGAPAPRNQAAEIQKIMDLYDRAIAAGKPLPPQWLYDSLEAGRALPLPETPQQIQQDKAEVENMLIAKGGTVNVSPLDEHDIHIAEHMEAAAMHELLGPEYGDVVRALQEHIAEHEMSKQQTQGNASTTPSQQGGFGAMGGAASGAPQQPNAMPGQMPAQAAGGPVA